MLLILVIAAVSISFGNAIDLYEIESASDQGVLTMKAWKEYPFWTPNNKTYYKLKLTTNQNLKNKRIRFAIKWEGDAKR